jgi:cytochrome P450
MLQTANPERALLRPSRGALTHIPGDDGLPFLGHTFEILADPQGFTEKMGRRYGPVFRSGFLGETTVSCLGPEANEFFLLDPLKVLSSSGGWDPLLGRLFPRGLMLLDFEEHRLHRRALAVAFKAGPMRSYLDLLNEGIMERLKQWPRGRETLVYPAMKTLTLDLAGSSFLGAPLGDDLEAIKQALSAMVAASIAPIRKALPGTKMSAGMRGRALVIDYFGKQMPLRRETGGDDLFSQLCRVTYEDGSFLSAEDVVNHMNFFMLAAYDTLTATLTGFVYRLADNPDWQEALRDEVAAAGAKPGEPLPYDSLEKLPLTEMAIKETMRMTPPVPSIPRRSIRAFEIMGYEIPANTWAGINPLHTHYMPEIWPEPRRFDPTRFNEEASQKRHRFAYVPFGGGAHMCLGLNFAYMQAKCFAWHFLASLRVSVTPGYRPRWRMWPIPRPADGLRVTFSNR